METCEQSLDSDSIHGEDQIQNGDSPGGSLFYPTGQLDGLDRSSRRVSSDPHSLGQQEVSEIHDRTRENAVLIHMPFSLNSTSSLHTFDGSCFRNAPPNGHPNAQVPR